MSRFRPLLLLISALGLSLAFAPFPLRFLAYFSLVGLFWAIKDTPPGRTFLYGCWFGLCFFLSHLWWLYGLQVELPGPIRILLWIGVTLLCCYLGAYIGLFALGIKWLGLPFAPFLWAGLELLRSKGEIGFPWGLLGATQTPYLPLIQSASILGVYGVSAWVVGVNCAIYYWLCKPRSWRWITLLALFLIPLSYGWLRLKGKGEEGIRVALVQPNVPPEIKGEVPARDSLFYALIAQSREALRSKPRLLVYPETAALVNLDRHEPYRCMIQELVDSSGSWLLTGMPFWRYRDGEFEYYNGAVLIVPHQGIVERYKKRHMTPFSERIPYEGRLKFLKRLDLGGSHFTPGQKYTVFELDGTRFSVLICFESIFPGLTRGFTSRGADLLINITNDGWFGSTPGPHQHCELSIMRSVENGVPLLRCANNGISLLADPYGRVLKRTGLFSKENLSGSLPGPLPPTPYRRYGDWFACLSLVLCLGAGVFRLLGSRGRR